MAHRALPLLVLGFLLAVVGCNGPSRAGRKDQYRVGYRLRVSGPTSTLDTTQEWRSTSRGFVEDRHDKVVVFDFASEMCTWWNKSGRFYYQRPIADVLLADYLVRYGVMTGGPMLGVDEGDGTNLVSDLVGAAIGIVAGSELDALHLISTVVTALLESRDWGVTSDRARKYMALRPSLADGSERFVGAGTRRLVVFGNGHVLRTMYVWRYRKPVVSAARLKTIVRAISGDSLRRADTEAWHAFLGDGYVALKDDDFGSRRQLTATSAPERTQGSPEDSLRPPSDRVICDNRGEVVAASWDPVSFNGQAERAVLITRKGPQVASSGVTVSCTGGNRAGLLQARIVAGPIGSKARLAGEVVQWVEMTDRETVHIPAAGDLSRVPLGLAGQVYAQVLLDGRVIASTPLYQRVAYINSP